jgi:hypothetical protein
MLVELPNWAGFLYYVSYAFPGRHFMLAADALLNRGNPACLLSLAGCSLAWLALGYLTVLAKVRKSALAVE